MEKSLKLEELPFQYSGKTYMLRCNMSVLADVQQMNGGKISEAIDGKSGFWTILQFLSAMMNDYADLMGWPERFTPRSLGRTLKYEDLPSDEIADLFISAFFVPDDGEGERAGN